MSPGPNPRPKPYPSPGPNQVFYLGEDDQWDDGDSISWGDKGEVIGSVEDVDDKGKVIDPPVFLLVVACSRGQKIHPSGNGAARAAGHPPPRKPAALRGAVPSSLGHERSAHTAWVPERSRAALWCPPKVAGLPTALPWAHAGLPAHA